MTWVYSKWWKWLSVVLLIYVVAGSFFVPLAPGITRVIPLSFRTDSVYTFQLTAYHSHLASPEAGKVQLWFKNGNTYYAPISFKVIDNEKAEAQFAVSSLQQEKFKPSSLDVVINNELDGTFALREAVVLIKSPVADSLSTVSATVTEPEVKNNHANLVSFPYREILYETIRNTFFHVPMWFAMTMLGFASLIASISYLVTKESKYDLMAEQSVVVAILFGVCGYLTGLVWAKYTWYIGSSWGDVVRKLLLEDVKMAAALVAIFFYVAYLILRGAMEDKMKRGNISAICNIATFVIFILCIYVLPRLTDSMHPGNGGNPAFSKYDLDSTLRMFFYPAVIGWILLSFWILSILMRYNFIKQKREL